MGCMFTVALSRLNSTDWQAAVAAVCKIGHVLCISSGVRQNIFGDSQGVETGSLMHKYVIEDPSTLFVCLNPGIVCARYTAVFFQVLPCSLAQLEPISAR
jgi:hypothetical protein